MSASVISRITAYIGQSIEIKQRVLQDEGLISQVASLAGECNEALRSGGKVIFAGNGGSFADAQHLAAEFVSRFMTDRAPLPSVALGTNSSVLSAVGNDYGYEQVFARELRAIAEKNDLFIPITTSGNSRNVLEAISVANEIGMRSVCLTGETGGEARQICECICIPSTMTGHIQECHITIGHIVCWLVEQELTRQISSINGGN